MLCFSEYKHVSGNTKTIVDAFNIDLLEINCSFMQINFYLTFTRMLNLKPQLSTKSKLNILMGSNLYLPMKVLD